MKTIGLIPGFWLTSQSLTFIAEAFTSAGFKVVMLDVTKSAKSTFSDYIEEVRKQVISEQVDFLFGFSAGGLISAKIAEQLPDQIKALILYAPAVSLDIFSVRNRYQFWGILKTLWRMRKPWFKLSKDVSEMMLFNQHSVFEIDWDYEQFSLESTRAFISSLIPGVKIKQVKQPSFIIVGSADRITPPEAVIKFAGKFRLCQKLHIVDGLDHMALVMKDSLYLLDEPIKFLQSFP